MKTKPKLSVVKRTTSAEKLKAKLWDEFIKNSSIPWEQLSEEWKDFYVQQGYIETASETLEELAIKAVGEEK